MASQQQTARVLLGTYPGCRVTVLSYLQAATEKALVEDRDIARSIKQEFDRKHGPTWHCVVGKHFGKTVTSPSVTHQCFNCGSAIMQSTKEQMVVTTCLTHVVVYSI